MVLALGPGSGAGRVQEGAAERPAWDWHPSPFVHGEPPPPTLVQKTAALLPNLGQALGQQQVRGAADLVAPRSPLGLRLWERQGSVCLGAKKQTPWGD